MTLSDSVVSVPSGCTVVFRAQSESGSESAAVARTSSFLTQHQPLVLDLSAGPDDSHFDFDKVGRVKLLAQYLESGKMGKSSLMVRTARRMREKGVHVVVLDITAIGQNLQPDQWHDGMLLSSLWRSDEDHRVHRTTPDGGHREDSQALRTVGREFGPPPAGDGRAGRGLSRR